MKIKADDVFTFIAVTALTSAMAWAMSCEQQAKDKRDAMFKQPTEKIDSTKTETKRDTVLVLDYKPRAKHSYSTTYATNKFGYVYKINDPKNLPVERGDEIVIDVHKHTAPNGDTRTEYELVKNMTTEKLKQEYMKKH